MNRNLCVLLLMAFKIIVSPLPGMTEEPLIAKKANINFRRPKNDVDLKRWLENMVWHHRFSLAEVSIATGLSAQEVRQALLRFKINEDTKPARNAGAPLLVLPYPGGRHPRIGFLEGAIDPQRETKLSVFTPWDNRSYVVIDVPEAIWWKEGKARELLYLAHTHIETTWTKQDVKLEPLEWSKLADGTLQVQRRLPNGVSFGSRVHAKRDHVRMEMWLTNGSKQRLSGLDVQNCVMLKSAIGFNQQSNENITISHPYVARKAQQKDRWIIVAWDPCKRPWGNPPCPCMHSDPKFPDCLPGETKQLRGWLSFYQGNDLPGELKRIETTGWRK